MRENRERAHGRDYAERMTGVSDQETIQVNIQMFEVFQPALIVAEDLADGTP